MSVSWNPWHGCRKLSEGCRHCYVYRQDAQHDKDSREVRRTAAFNLPVRRTRLLNRVYELATRIRVCA